MQFLSKSVNLITTIFTWLWDLARSSEGISTILVILIMLLKLYTNNKATDLQKKSLAISIPSEITVLIIGFLISAALSNNETKDYSAIIILTLISLILLICLYVSERNLGKKLSGTWSLRVWVTVILMYVLSVAFYIIVVFGGVI